MDKYIEGAKKIIEENIYLTLATSSKKGKPWISPLFFAYDPDYNLYWVSSKYSRHSQLIAENPKVAITIFDSKAPEGDGDAVYFEATAVDVESANEIEKAMNIFNSRVTKDEFRIKKIEDVSGNGIWRITKASPIKIFKLTEGEVVNGQYIDKKVEVKLH